MPIFMGMSSPPSPEHPAQWPGVVMEAKPQSIVRTNSRPQSITIGSSRANSINSNKTRPLSLGVGFDRSFSSPSVLERPWSVAVPSPTSRLSSPLLSRPGTATRSPPHSFLYNLSALARRTSIAEEQGTTPTSQARVVIGMDWGTTYSGVAIVHSAQPNDIDVIKTWPGSNSITSDKVPSEISYDAVPTPSRPSSLIMTALPSPPTLPSRNDAPMVGSERKKTSTQHIRWGFQLKPEERRLRCLKLFLDRNQTLPSYVSPLDTAKQLKSHGRTVLDGASDYLNQIRKHTMNTLYRRYGPDFESDTKVEFVLTVPAMWSDAAKHATLMAAEIAGMGTRRDVRLISEPEAAAVYTLMTFLPSFVKIGDNVIICDAGGGTVDIIAYRILQLLPLRIEESVVGTGSLCGSAFINFRFEDHIRSRLGEDRYRYIRETKPKIWHTAFRHFEETVKRSFNYKLPRSPSDTTNRDSTSSYDDGMTDDEPETDFSIPLPGLADDEAIGLDAGFLLLSAVQVKELFDPIIDQIVGLLQAQVNGVHARGDTVAAIILVGGFGQSKYLYSRLETHFQSLTSLQSQKIRSHPDVEFIPESLEALHTSVPLNAKIEILQPPHAWTAIARGAALVGINASQPGPAGSSLDLAAADTSSATDDLTTDSPPAAAPKPSTLNHIRPSNSIVQTRRSRYHYGTSYATVYDAAKGHSVRERYWSPLWERWMVADRMAWHVAKGQVLSSSSFPSTIPEPSSTQSPDPPADAAAAIPKPGAARITYTRNFLSTPTPDPSNPDDIANDPDHHPLNTLTPLIVEDELFACSDDLPPAVFDSLSCTPVCTLLTDLTQVPKSYFQTLQTKGGVRFERLEFSLVMRFQDEENGSLGDEDEDVRSGGGGNGNGNGNGALGFELWVRGTRFGGTAVRAEFH